MSHESRRLWSWLIFDVGQSTNMKRLLSFLFASVVYISALGSPAIVPSTRHQFDVFKKTMMPQYDEIIKAIDTRMPTPRDPQLRMRRREIDSLIETIRVEAVPKISRHIERDQDLKALAEAFDWLSGMVQECEIQVNRYVLRAVAVGELRLDLGLHLDLETFAAHSGSFRQAFGIGYREEIRKKAKQGG